MARSPLSQTLLRALQLARRKNYSEQGRPSPVADKNTCSRRQFLSVTTTVGASGLLGTVIPSNLIAASSSIAQNGEMPPVAIIGGGIAGLNAAYQLKHAGINAMVYEASHRLGGRILSQTGAVGEELTTEIGAEFINSDHADMLGLVDDFGLSLFDRLSDTDNFPFPANRYYFEGISWSEEDLADLLRPLVDQIDNDARLLDDDWDSYAPQFDALSVADYLDQYSHLISAPFIRVLIENTIRTEYGAEPGESSALQLLFNLPVVDGQSVELLGYSDEAYVVQGGNDKIIDGLVAALSGQIQTGMQLTKISKSRRNHYRLSFKNGEVVRARYVIMAIPFTVLREVDLRVSLPHRFRQFIEDVKLGRNEKLLAGFSNKAWLSSPGFSGAAWTDLGYSEVWYSTQSQLELKSGALSFFLGGNEVNGLEEEGKVSVKQQGREFIERLATYIPGIADAATGKMLRTRWSQNRFSQGAYTNFRPGQYTRYGDLMWIESDDPAERQEVRFGNLIFAGEQVSDAYYGFMNGGAQTGRLAADTVIQSISKDIASNV